MKSFPVQRFLWSILCCLVSVSPAIAQETYATLIDNQASATVDVTPTSIQFNLSRTYAGESLAQAVVDAETLATELRAALKEADYERAALEVSGPMIADANTTSVRVDAEIRLGLGGTSAEGARSTALARATDTVNAIADKLGCETDGPILDVSDRSETENKAVQRAIENAYTRAQAAATVMRLEIVSVDRVTIESVTWHDRPDESRQESSADRIGVTVEIRVAYLAFPPSN